MPTFGYKSNIVIVSSEYEKRTEGGKSGDGSVLFAYNLRALRPLMVIPASSLMLKVARDLRFVGPRPPFGS